MHLVWFSMRDGFFSPRLRIPPSRLRRLWHLHHAKYIAQSWRSWQPCEMDLSHNCSQHGGMCEVCEKSFYKIILIVTKTSNNFRYKNIAHDTTLFHFYLLVRTNCLMQNIHATPSHTSTHRSYLLYENILGHNTSIITVGYVSNALWTICVICD